MSALPDAGEANRLYWESDVSVSEIAAKFDLSRRGLYQVVRPLGTGVLCPDCHAELTFENRLSRRTGVAVCSSCGARLEIDGDPHASTFAQPRLAAEAPGRQWDPLDDRAYLPELDARAEELRSRAVLLGGAAIAGLAIGTVAALWARRRA